MYPKLLNQLSIQDNFCKITIWLIKHLKGFCLCCPCPLPPWQHHTLFVWVLWWQWMYSNGLCLFFLHTSAQVHLSPVVRSHPPLFPLQLKKGDQTVGTLLKTPVLCTVQLSPGLKLYIITCIAEKKWCKKVKMCGHKVTYSLSHQAFMAHKLWLIWSTYYRPNLSQNIRWNSDSF